MLERGLTIEGSYCLRCIHLLYVDRDLPRGFSANLLLFSGEYLTIHLSPEPECSYLSVETNAAGCSSTDLYDAVHELFKPKDLQRRDFVIVDAVEKDMMKLLPAELQEVPPRSSCGGRGRQDEQETPGPPSELCRGGHDDTTRREDQEDCSSGDPAGADEITPMTRAPTTPSLLDDTCSPTTSTTSAEQDCSPTTPDTCCPTSAEREQGSSFTSSKPPPRGPATVRFAPDRTQQIHKVPPHHTIEQVAQIHKVPPHHAIERVARAALALEDPESSVALINLTAVRNQLHAWEDEFAGARCKGGKITPFYAMKCNPDPVLLETIASFQDGEVVC